jgi:hypothetical protein
MLTVHNIMTLAIVHFSFLCLGDKNDTHYKI